MNNIGKNIKAARKAAKLTQEPLANALGIQRAAISKYEKGLVSPTIETITKIAEVLKVPVSQLLSEAPEQPTEQQQETREEPQEHDSFNAVADLIYTLAQEGNTAEYTGALKAAILAFGAERRK